MQPTPQQVSSYRERGFVKIEGVISTREAARFRETALAFAAAHPPIYDRPIFDQFVNSWTQDDGMRAVTLHENIARVATALAGEPLRLWHDQILIKQPHNNAATELHQDQPYWPHANGPHPISCWLALQDVPIERGCMTFLPGSHRRTDLAAQNLGDGRSLFSLAPDLEWEERVTVPLRAGDCTFHHGRCAHMATPNFTEEARVAHIVIFMPRTTTYNGKAHVVTDPLGLKVGDALAGEMFPDVG
jgi:ectoine hydroxylase-related dioxygenase (phytanoyl-CoA dioxygenase family)